MFGPPLCGATGVGRQDVDRALMTAPPLSISASMRENQVCESQSAVPVSPAPRWPTGCTAPVIARP